jgi:hypothetical protein
LQNAIVPAPPAALKPVAKKVLKPVPRPEEATKAIYAGSDENRKPSEGAATSPTHKLRRKKVVNTLTLVLSHRSKVS